MDDDNSDSDDSVKVDPFQFQKKSFASNRKRNQDDESSSSSSSDEDNNNENEKAACKKKRIDLTLNSEDSSDSEPYLSPKTKQNYDSNIPKKISNNGEPSCYNLLESSDEDEEDNNMFSMVDCSRTRVSTRARPNTASFIAPLMKPTNQENSETLNVLRKAQEAKQKLLQAQMTTLSSSTIDLDISPTSALDFDEPDPLIIETNDVKPKNSNHLGCTIKIVVRNSPTQKESFKIRSMESFQNLMTSFLNRHNLLSTATIQIQFQLDGENLRLTDTPQHYDLEDGDIIDVVIKNKLGRKITLSTAIAMIQNDPIPLNPSVSPAFVCAHKNDIPIHNTFPATINSTLSNETSSLSVAQVVLQTRIITKTNSTNILDLWQIKCSDPFEKLLTAFVNKKNILNRQNVNLEYNYKTLDLKSTPYSVGMMGGNTKSNPILIDIRIRSNDGEDNSNDIAVVTVAGSTNTSANIPIKESMPMMGKKLSFKLRINGKDASIQELTMGEQNGFQFLIDKFCLKNKKQKSQVTFILDGEAVNPNMTPQSEDLEGGEILDVIIKEELNQINDQTKTPATNGKKANIHKRLSTTREVRETSSINTIMTIQTIRNKAKTRPKRFQVKQSDTIESLKKAYIQYYKNKGCKTVKFYYRDNLIRDGRNPATFTSLGIQEFDSIYAMENGKRY